MTLNDLELTKWNVLVNFLAISGCVTHFTSELHRNGWRWTWTTCVWYFWQNVLFKEF